MSEVHPRPKKGLPAEEALKQWSDPAAYRELVELAGTEDLPSYARREEIIRDRDRANEYGRKRTALEEVFKAKLVEGTVLASGISKWSDRREVIEPSLWELLEIQYDLWGEAAGEDRKYEAVEFFELSAIPLSVRTIPAWLEAELGAAGASPFQHDPSYRHVWLNDIPFVFGTIQARVVKLLHQAVLEGDPWQPGPLTLERAESAQLKMGDLFKDHKNWKLLIKSDGRGMYRLRIDQFGNPDE